MNSTAEPTQVPTKAALVPPSLVEPSIYDEVFVSFTLMLTAIIIAFICRSGMREQNSKKLRPLDKGRGQEIELKHLVSTGTRRRSKQNFYRITVSDSDDDVENSDTRSEKQLQLA